MLVLHYTNRDGWSAIRSQAERVFRATQPRAQDKPRAAYFTTLRPEHPRLAARLRIPKMKLGYLFAFRNEGLPRLENLRGGRTYILYSRTDYPVDTDHQVGEGMSSEVELPDQ